MSCHAMVLVQTFLFCTQAIAVSKGCPVAILEALLQAGADTEEAGTLNYDPTRNTYI